MIDTSIVRVHQNGACIIRNRKQSMGRSRGGLEHFWLALTTLGLASICISLLLFLI